MMHISHAALQGTDFYYMIIYYIQKGEGIWKTKINLNRIFRLKK